MKNAVRKAPTINQVSFTCDTDSRPTGTSLVLKLITAPFCTHSDHSWWSLWVWEAEGISPLFLGNFDYCYFFFLWNLNNWCHETKNTDKLYFIIQWQHASCQPRNSPRNMTFYNNLCCRLNLFIFLQTSEIFLNIWCDMIIACSPHRTAWDTRK